MVEKKRTFRYTARMAGYLYLALAISGAIGIMYIPSQIFVTGNFAETAQNILQKEFLFRAGVLSNLFCQTLFIFLVLTLYRLFVQVNILLARIMVALVMVAVPIAYFIIFNQLFALTILKEDFMIIFEPAQRQALAQVFLKMYNNGILVIGIFWGLWLIPFGQLVFRSGFMPKILGILLIIGGVTYVIDAVTFILLPKFHTQTSSLVGIASSVAELAMVLWLLIKGVQNNKASELMMD